MKTFPLEIISQEKVVLKDDAVEAVSVTTIDGDISILADHMPYISVLAPSEIVIKKNGEEHLFAGTGGILEVTPERVSILVDSAIRSDEIDEAQAQAARERAEKLVAEAATDRESATAAAALEKALLHIRIARKRRHL